MTLNAATINAGIAALLPRLRRFARCVAGHSDLADDLVQAAVELALKGTPLEPGLRLDVAMFRKVRPALSLQPPPRSMPSPDQPLQKAVAMLREEQRMIIGLVLADGLSYKEAAAVLGIPVATLSSRLLRARAALHGLLSDQSRTVA